MSFEFLENIILNSYVILLGVILIVYLIFIFEKKSAIILLQVLVDCIIIAFGLLRNIFLDHNMFLTIWITTCAIGIFNSTVNLKFSKKLYISILAQIIENTVLLIATFFLLKLKRIGNEFEELNDTNLKIIFTSILTIGLVFCNKLNIDVIKNISQLKEKTEEIDSRTLYDNGMKICKDKVENNIISIIILYILVSFISIMFMNNINFDEQLIKEMGIEILITSILSIIIVLLSIAICNFLYSILNSKKEIYKTVSDNKLEEKRTLKI